MLVRNGRDLLGLETPKSAVSEEWIDEMSWFFSWWYKFRKAKSFGKNLVENLTIINHLPSAGDSQINSVSIINVSMDND